MAFGSKVRELRKAKKISQEDFGKMITLSPKHISKIENNKLIPYAETVKKIADIFNVSTDYLLFENVPKNTDLSRVNDAELVDLIFKVNDLSEGDRSTAKNVIKALITQAKAQELFK